MARVGPEMDHVVELEVQVELGDVAIIEGNGKNISHNSFISR